MSVRRVGTSGRVSLCSKRYSEGFVHNQYVLSILSFPNKRRQKNCGIRFDRNGEIKWQFAYLNRTSERGAYAFPYVPELSSRSRRTDNHPSHEQKKETQCSHSELESQLSTTTRLSGSDQWLYWCLPSKLFQPPLERRCTHRSVSSHPK